MDNKNLADWIVNTILMYGGTVPTAYLVAGLFTQAIDAARAKESGDA